MLMDDELCVSDANRYQTASTPMNEDLKKRMVTLSPSETFGVVF